MAYGYRIIHLFDPNTQGDLGFNYQPWYGHPHSISIFKIHRMDYHDRDFTELKYTDILTPTYLEGSIPSWLIHQLLKYWLCPKIFHHWIKNSDSLASKHSELLASHRGDLRLEGHLYSYRFRITFDSRVLRSWSHSVKYTPIFHLHAIQVSPCSLVKRIINLYDTQWSTLDMSIILVITYHLVVNSFKD